MHPCAILSKFNYGGMSLIDCIKNVHPFHALRQDFLWYGGRAENVHVGKSRKTQNFKTFSSGMLNPSIILHQKGKHRDCSILIYSTNWVSNHFIFVTVDGNLVYFKKASKKIQRHIFPILILDCVFFLWYHTTV